MVKDGMHWYRYSFGKLWALVHALENYIVCIDDEFHIDIKVYVIPLLGEKVTILMAISHFIKYVGFGHYFFVFISQYIRDGKY